MKLQFGAGRILFGLFVVLTFISCASKPATYLFVPEESSSASISFKTGNPNVRFVSFDGRVLPTAEKGTRWEPIVFPAGRPLQVTVHAYYEHQQKVAASGGLLGLVSDVAGIVSTLTRGVDMQVVLTCPALMPGTKYQLSFKKESGIPGKNFLVLTDLSTKKVIYQQEFEVKENK